LGGEQKEEEGMEESWRGFLPTEGERLLSRYEWKRDLTEQDW